MSTDRPALDYVRGRVPLYTLRDVAAFVGMPESTLGTWANGYERRPAGRSPVVGGPVITRFTGLGHGPSVPFISLAEAMSLAALRRKEGTPLPQVRRVVDYVERELGLEHALASQDLYLVGATFVYDFAKTRGNAELMDLVEVVNGQAVWTELVREYLINVAWDTGGWPERIRLPRYRIADIAVDPYHGSGSPYFAANGVSVASIVGRARGGDSDRPLARDYDLPIGQVGEVLDDQLDRAA
jgi:uncharacterized protein (DUF433 family)